MRDTLTTKQKEAGNNSMEFLVFFFFFFICLLPRKLLVILFRLQLSIRDVQESRDKWDRLGWVSICSVSSCVAMYNFVQFSQRFVPYICELNNGINWRCGKVNVRIINTSGCLLDVRSGRTRAGRLIRVRIQWQFYGGVTDCALFGWVHISEYNYRSLFM